jgi:hypothetical protein
LADSRLVRPPATSRPFTAPYPDWDLFYRSYTVGWSADFRSVTSLSWQVVDNRDPAIYGSDPALLTVYSRQIDRTQVPLGTSTTRPGDLSSGSSTGMVGLSKPGLFWCKMVDANGTLFGPENDFLWTSEPMIETFSASSGSLRSAVVPGSDGKDLYFLLATYRNGCARVDYRIGLEVWDPATRSWDPLAGKDSAGTARVPARSSGVAEVYGQDHLVPIRYKHEVGPHMPVYMFRFTGYAPGDPDGKPSYNNGQFTVKAPPGGGHTIEQD